MSSTESTNPAAGNRVTDPGTTPTPTRVLDEKSDTNTLSHHKNNQTFVPGQAGQVPVQQNIETSRNLLTSVEYTTESDELDTNVLDGASSRVCTPGDGTIRTDSVYEFVPYARTEAEAGEHSCPSWLNGGAHILGDDEVIGGAAALAQAMIEDGLDEDVAFEIARSAVLDVSAHYDAVVAKTLPTPVTLAEKYQDTRSSLASLWKQINRLYRPSEKLTSLRQLTENLFHLVEGTMSNVVHAILGLFELIAVAFKEAYQATKEPLFHLIDSFIPERRQRDRIKTLWSIGGTVPDGRLDFYRRWIASGIKAEAIGTTTFSDDYNRLVTEILDRAPMSVPIGGDQSRKPKLPSRPVMSLQEARALGKVDTARISELLTARNATYLSMGAKQGADGVWAAAHDESLIAASIDRYTTDTKIPALDSVQVGRAREIAEALVQAYPDALSGMDLTPGRAAWEYINHKYSPGSPFLRYYRERAQLDEAGLTVALMRTYRDRILEGRYEPQFYHAFVKSQVVAIEPVVLHLKNVRTVVAQDLASYFVDQFFQFERNKRLTWQQTATGSGMPLNQNMESIFSEAAKCKQLYGLDGHEFDSNIGPFGFEILSQLAAIGYQGQPGGDTAASFMRAKYDAMQDSWIISLPTGKITRKVKGGGTGQSATSFDNTWAMKGMVIAAWCDSTGRSPTEFFRDMVFHNNSDDNIFAARFDRDDFEIDKFILAAQAYQLELRVETQGSLEDLVYLGKRARPPNDADNRMLDYWKAVAQTKLGGWKTTPKSPELVVYQDAASILMRRTGLRYYQSAATKVTESLLDRSVGHAYLCAFRPDLYNLFLSEFYEDARRYLGKENAHCVRYGHDKTGHRQIVIDTPTGASHALRSRLVTLRKSKRFPSYAEVVVVHMRPLPDQAKAKRKKIAKIYKPLGIRDHQIRVFLQTVSDVIDAFPREFRKISPGPDMLYPDAMFLTKNMIVEKYVYLYNRPTNYVDFQRLLDQSPYTACTHGPAFWTELQTKQFTGEMDRYPKEVYRGAVLAITVAYWFLSVFLLNALSVMPILGLFIASFNLVWIKLPTLFMTLGLASWSIFPRSSPLVARLMPRDVYGRFKQAAAFVVDQLPLELWYLPGFLVCFLEFLPDAMDDIAKLYTRWQSVKAGPAMGQTSNQENQWLPFVPTIRKSLERVPTIITAKTGSGKSTYLIAALCTTSPQRIWLLTPRRILRDNTVVPGFKAQSISRGIEIEFDTDVIKCTYGHFLNRLDTLQDDDLVVFDEFHESSGEMIAAYAKVRCQRLLLSATPSMDIAPDAELIKLDLSGLGFETKTVELEGNAVSLYQQAADMFPTESKRALIIVPTLREVFQTIAALEYLGIPSTELSRNQPIPAEEGVIVATQIVDAGMDIKPGVTMVVDCGKEFVVHEGVPAIQPSRPQTRKQRAGRTGRLGNGVYVTTSSSGTGKAVKAYPSMHMLMEEEVADHFELPMLINARDPVHHMIPFVEMPDPLDLPCMPYMLMSLAGIQDHAMPDFYKRHFMSRVPMPEEYDLIEKIWEGCHNGTDVLGWRQMMRQVCAKRAFSFHTRNGVIMGPGLWAANGKYHTEPGTNHQRPPAQRPKTLSVLWKVLATTENISDVVSRLTDRVLTGPIYVTATRMLASADPSGFG